MFAILPAWGLSNAAATMVYWAITIAFSTLGVAGAVVFRRGGWKSKVV